MNSLQICRNDADLKSLNRRQMECNSTTSCTTHSNQNADEEEEEIELFSILGRNAHSQNFASFRWHFVLVIILNHSTEITFTLINIHNII